ncbi:MAG TPA: YcnI family protein [Baekduia sp.]|uniref:YcnI family copper-binding membrane protein n=1 Tax=Baekduia sp. TaxID=2600305 RepID=UPI002C98BDB3|nr:YcnI family protein [Baekduia sp.]HMJ35557.1 YcnI family protein [Baekduia sp.]
MKQRITLATSIAAGVLALPAAADAHVTLQPKQVPAGGFVVENVRVPNETDGATTTKVEVQFPEGFASVSYQPVAGWSTKVAKEKLATPVKTDDGEVTEGVKTITWTAKATSAGIAPGQFHDFPLSVQVPGKAGDTLTFKALQTYSDGSVVRWIGAPDADHPAPQLDVIAAADPHGAAPSGGTGTATTEATSAPAPVAATTTSDGDSSTLGVIALIVGALGLLAGGGALAASRKRG